jgi:cytochrome c peroxidase
VRSGFTILAVFALGALACGGDSTTGPNYPVEPISPVEPVPPVEPGPPGGPTAWEWDLPPGFPVPAVPADNPMTVEKVDLGRHLFYDRRLSIDESQSCGSCHQQARGFAEPRPTSVGATGEPHPRNASGLTNVAYNPTLTWANPNLVLPERQMLTPLFGEDPVELGLAGKEAELLGRLRVEPLYRELFRAAYPDAPDPFTLQSLVQSIASFERSLISGNSRFDQYVYQGDDDALSEEARRGLDIFNSESGGDCFHCHGGLNFASALTHEGNLDDRNPFENNGLYNIGGSGDYPPRNQGLYEFTGLERDRGRFKPPTLRNVEVSGPYMHDGSIPDLEGVVAHYAAGGRLIEEGRFAGDGRLNPHKSDFVTGFPARPVDIRDLVSFLESLTDWQFLEDPRLADPFSNDEE